MPQETVKIGLVGAGTWAATVHIPNLLRVRGATLQAVCTRSPENARRAAQAAGRDVPAFADYGRFLADAGCDAAIICTPNWLHEEHALRALQAGLHVLVEKPVSLTAEGCERLARAVERSGCTFQTGLELRYADVARAARRLVEQGRLGRLLLVIIHVMRNWGVPGGWRGDVAHSGGLFPELVCHYTDLAAYLIGEQPILAAAAGGAGPGGRFAEYASTTLTYPCGAAASLNVCICTAEPECEIPLELVGDKGLAEGGIIAGRLRLFERGRGGHEDLSPPRPAGYRFDGFPGSLESLESFVDCVRRGEQPVADFAAGRAAVLTALACGESLAAGQPRRAGVPIRQ